MRSSKRDAGMKQNMYKVVIVDDEPLIAEGLSDGITWKKWDCEVVAVADNGTEGLKIIDEVSPDILFTDINMPEMDGLQMIAALRSAHPDMQITILTGYGDFDYAKEAIRLGVSRYLLKPSKMDEIQEAIEGMIKKLNERKGTQKVLDLYETIVQQKQIEEEGKPAAAEVPDEEEESDDSEASSFVVNNAIKYIEQNYMMKMKLSDVADQVYVSQWHLSKLLNRYKGQSFSDILNHIRIEKAKELLKDPSLRIGDVADMVGFLDLAHFSRVFKKLTGSSANEYRNKLLK